MSQRTKKIHQVINELSFVKELIEFKEEGKTVHGKVNILLPDSDTPILINFIIYPQYPFKNRGSESLTFFNKELIEYSHVMEQGNICFHSVYYNDIEKKLISDFNLLALWIKNYIIKKSKDSHYEHLILNHNSIRDSLTYYIFADTEGKFKEREFGVVNLSPMTDPDQTDLKITNYLITSFKSSKKELKKCKWSKYYRDLRTLKNGLYYFLEDIPDLFDKFIINDWIEFDKLLSKEFLDYLYQYEKRNRVEMNGLFLPVFFGYEYSNEQVYWNVAMLQIGKFPLVGVAERKEGKKTGKWVSQFTPETINWVNSKKVTYELFFGRGALSRELIGKRILVIGVGAIGSILAKTLVKGGSKYLDIADFDLKYPENVCRSDYFFATGVIHKTDELQRTLIAISPFVDVGLYEDTTIEKYKESNLKDLTVKEQLIDELNSYDIIFDCSADNDLMYILDCLDLKNICINISITNHASELVCAFNPNIFNFVNNQFTRILNNKTDDLYNPTGCWEPTFRASYNDIDILLQLAIRKINSNFNKLNKQNNFVVKESQNGSNNFEVVDY